MDIRRHRIICAILTAALLSGLTGCAQAEVDSHRTYRIGIVEYNATDTYITALVDCLQEDLQTYIDEGQSISVTIKDGAGNQRTENSRVDELIDGGCDLLFMNLVDRAAGSYIIDLAAENDIPVIFFNREPVREDLLQVKNLYYVGAEAEESGTMQGELAVDIITAAPSVDRNKDGKIQFVMLQGEAGHQDSIIRTENAVATMEEHGIELDKLSYSVANWSRAQAQNQMTQLISQYGNSIELVLANNDDMALGVIDAYNSRNISSDGWPVILGTDGTDAGLTAIQAGTMSATVYQDKEGQAQAMADLAMALLTDGDLSGFDFVDERYIYLPYEKVTAENVQEYMN